MQTANGEAEIAQSSAEGALALVDAAARNVDGQDPISLAGSFSDNISFRDSSPYEPDHPRPYEFLMDATADQNGLPDNLFDTLFSTDNFGLGSLLAIGLNTYAVYVNFTSKDNGPSYEAWAQGTFTGELIVDGQIVLFSNYIDIDGDGADDLSVGLTIEGLFTQDDGWGIVTENGGPLGLVPFVTGLWINPTFQWKVSALDQSDPIWAVSYTHLTLPTSG